MVKPVREAYESHVDCGLYEGRENTIIKIAV